MNEKPPTYATAKTFTPPSEEYSDIPADLLEEFYRQIVAAKTTSGMFDVTIRFKNGRARWIGVQTWAETEKGE